MSRSRYYCKGRANYYRGESDYLRDRLVSARARDRRGEALDGELEWEDHRGDYSSEHARIAMVHEVRHRGPTRRHLTLRQYRAIGWQWFRDYTSGRIAAGEHVTVDNVGMLIEAIEQQISRRRRPLRPAAEAVRRSVMWAQQIRAKSRTARVLHNVTFTVSM